MEPPAWFINNILKMVNLLDVSDLRSSVSKQVFVSKTNLNIGKCDFSIAAPIIWNHLPTTFKSCETLAKFRNKLSIFCFKLPLKKIGSKCTNDNSCLSEFI